MGNVYCIAEIGQAHDGSIGMVHSFIDAVSKTGVDAIKFQIHIAEAESSEFEQFRVNFSYQDKTRYDYWKRMEFTYDQWKEIKSHSEDEGLEFMATPFSNAAVDILENLEVNRYKIGSGDVGNFLLLERIKKTGKQIILSSGLSNYSEMDASVRLFDNYINKISILQCTTKYPTLPSEVGLNAMTEYRERYKVPVGLSDHSGTIYPSFAAVALGAEIIEVHATFDKKMFGPDSSSSLTIDELAQLVEGIRVINEVMNNPVDKNIAQYEEAKRMFGRSLAINKDLMKGHEIMFEDLEAKKPFGHGMHPSEYELVIGKKLRRNLKKWTFLEKEDLE